VLTFVNLVIFHRVSQCILKTCTNKHRPVLRQIIYNEFLLRKQQGKNLVKNTQLKYYLKHTILFCIVLTGHAEIHEDMIYKISYFIGTLFFKKKYFELRILKSKRNFKTFYNY
jgi:hypothetical protein